MVQGLAQWGGRVTAVVLLAGATELLLPERGLRSWVRAILSLLVLLTMLQPVLSWLDKGAPVRWSLASEVASPATGGDSAPAREAALAAAAAYEHLVRQQVQRLAAALPGVASARVQLTFSPSGLSAQVPRVLEATVALRLQPGSALTADLTRRVRATVAAALELPLAQVLVVGG